MWKKTYKFYVGTILLTDRDTWGRFKPEHLYFKHYLFTFIRSLWFNIRILLNIRRIHESPARHRAPRPNTSDHLDPLATSISVQLLSALFWSFFYFISGVFWNEMLFWSPGRFLYPFLLWEKICANFSYFSLTNPQY